MVIFFEWHRTAVDQKSSSGLPMTGEDTGLGALASPLAGYLGKVQERAASLQYCPWCTSKGLTYALRSYRINLQESITLCTNPQCLFPLVSQSLEDVLASLDPVEPTVGNKRKNPLPLEKEESIKHSPKRLRSSEPDGLGIQSVTDTLISQEEHCAVNAISNGPDAAPLADGKKVNGYHRDINCPVAEITGWESLQDEEDEPDSSAGTEGSAPSTCSASAGPLQSSSEALLTTDGDSGAFSISGANRDFRQVKSHPEVLSRRCNLASNQSVCTNEDIYSNEINTPSPQLIEQTAMTKQKSLTADITTSKDIESIKLETQDLSFTSLTESEELVSVPSQLFWRNTDNLCWLDSLLVALVNCKSLRKCKPRDESQQSSVWQLIRGYEDICAAIQVHQQTDKDGVMKVPNHVLQKASADLQSLRMSVFKLLQPKLHCILGQRETPVFAMPLLLAMDSWVEPLFQSTFHWEFKCSECKAATTERIMKTLPTFTNIVPDWRPLHAVHSSPCNVCHKKNQRRTMMLESVPPVFVLHFVEGLPDNDVRIYTFNFKGKRYSVTMVIQYNHQLKHFVTWICNSDGSWQEYDDLKHPDCKTHQKLPVPAQEMHIIFWEVEEDKEPCVCSPSSTFSDYLTSKNTMNPSLCDKDSAPDELLACSPDQSLLVPHNDTDIVCALSVSKDSNIMDTTDTAGLDASIGSTTLLDTFEGLNHNDIITLTLVELNNDSEMQPLNGSEQTQDLSAPSKNEILDVSPDSSSAVMVGEMCHGPDVEPPTAASSSESADGSSSDPTFVPGARRGQGRRLGKGKAVTRQKGKKAASSKAAPLISPPVSSEPSKVIRDKLTGAAAAQENTPPVETTQQTSPVISTDTPPLSTSQKSPTLPPTLDQNARWSFLLSKHPLNLVHKSVAKLAPTHAPTSVTQVNPTPPTHSTPNPVRKQQIPGGLFPKPQLRTEESEGLPLKAAEMYGAFSAKSSNALNPLPSATPLNGKSKLAPSITSHHQKSLMTSTVVSGTLLPTLKAKGLPEISSSKKQSSHSSKLPPGLSSTELLRYKLMKKLKAKKKKLDKLNELLGVQGGASLRPDSTDLGSPNAVTSSTYDSSTCDDFLSDLLSPATTASNLSPDSTGFLEMVVNGQDGLNQLECGSNAIGAVCQTNISMNRGDTENFMDEFLSQAVAQRPTEMESEAFSALELFF
ncbi:SUMO-specific isopeptidase USPL1 isoform X1 [Lates calcarifer]|uniref:SUMO-specific isopeptidase USPL1 isoform X1 n=1 Tax=Lates calcarifer TaxID=8187 RepID=A0AAJ7Q5E2_LATCA|nr:SUMO-specific isopeptidase USPL1 isoform X1 [Lates calcarifer]